MASFTLSLYFSIFSLLVITVCSDIASDRAECSDSLVSLATCLPYVQATSKIPTPDCCAGLKQVLTTSKKCLCVLIRDRDDPDLGIKIDATRALDLPTVCQAKANISHCPELLNLPPGSKEAQIFEQGVKGNTPATPEKGNSTSSSSGTAGRSTGSPSKADSNSGPTRYKVVSTECFLVQLFFAFCISVLLPFLVSS